MIANGKGNFFSAHYDWLVAGLGVLALGAAAVFYVMAIGEDPETAAQDAVAEVKGRKPSKTGVKDEDVETCIEIIGKYSKKRTQPMPVDLAYGQNVAPVTTEVTVGGATIFVLNVEQFRHL